MSGTCVDSERDEVTASGGVVALLRRGLSGEWFALGMLSILVTFELWLVLLLLLPGSEHGLGSFADEFRIWCFGVDRATGAVSWGRVAAALSEPMLLGAIVAWLWRPVLSWNWTAAWAVLAFVSVGSVSAVGATLALSARAEAASAELPFPARQLRTALPAPDFALVDQTGTTVGLGELRGRVVVLTGIYASCNIACPLLMGQAKRALAALPPAERNQVTVLALTFDPRADTPEILAKTSVRYGVRAPEFRFLTGEPARVEEALAALQIPYQRMADSMLIDHANVFIVVDKRGRIAYRIPIGAREEHWLSAAMSGLAREPARGP